MKIPDDAIDTSTYVINTITKPEKYNNLFICYIAQLIIERLINFNCVQIQDN
jgi:hypothetical protein